MKMHVKIWSAKWQPFCSGGDSWYHGCRWPWRRKDPGHQLPWYWPNSQWEFPPQHQKRLCLIVSDTDRVINQSKIHINLYESPSRYNITRQIWGIWKLRPVYSPETPNLGQNLWCFVPCDLKIWWMTLENNRASLLCCFKLCATFHSHWWIQTGVTVRKRPIWVKFDDF